MDKNRFYLIVLLGIVIISVLFFQFNKMKNETLSEYESITSLTKKITEIKYLEKEYKSSPDKIVKKLKKCKINNSTNYEVRCENLNKKEFKYDSNLIFNSSLNILKFKIDKKDKLVSIYMEIAK